MLGPWEDETPLGGPLAFQAIATNGRTIILAGGASVSDTGELGWFGSVMWNALDDDGHLTDWYGESGVFDAPTLHGSATVHGDRAYFVGGGGGTVAFQPRVVSMRIGAETLEDPRDETPMTGGRSRHVSLAREGALYVMGGFTDPATPSPTPAIEVLRAAVDPTTGMIGAWESAGTIAEPQWTAAHVELTDALILVGGGVGDVPTARVVRYPLDATGVGEPELLSPLPYPRAHVHQTPVYGSRIYSVGGRYAKGLGQASSTDVYSAAIDELGSELPVSSFGRRPSERRELPRPTA